jgi:hypothetical protein
MNCHLRTIERFEEESYERGDYLALPTLTDDQVDILIFAERKLLSKHHSLVAYMTIDVDQNNWYESQSLVRSPSINLVRFS